MCGDPDTPLSWTSKRTGHIVDEPVKISSGPAPGPWSQNCSARNVPDDEFQNIAIVPHPFHGEWNYKIISQE